MKKSFKRSIAVILAVLMVVFSFPLSAFAIYNTNNDGVAEGEEIFTADYDVELHAYIMDYDEYDCWGYWSSTEGKTYDPTALSADDLASEDGVFVIFFTITGLDEVAAYQFTIDYDSDYIEAYTYARRGSDATGSDAGWLEVMTDYISGSGNAYTGYHGADQLYIAYVPYEDLLEETDISGTGDYILEGQLIGAVGFQLQTDETVDLTQVLRLFNTNVGCQIIPYSGCAESLYIVGYGATLALDYTWGGVTYEAGTVSPQTQFTWEEWGYAPDDEEEETDVEYTYTFADGSSETVTAEAGVEPTPPDNTESTVVSNEDGTHTVTTYSWPEWVEGTTEYTEVAATETVACTMVDVDGTAVDATHTDNGQAADQECSVCGYYVEGAVVTAEGHSWYVVSTTAATCVSYGTTTYACTGCDETLVETGTELDPTNHESVITDEAIAATCTVPGLTEGSHCEACNVTIVAQTVVDALGHNYEVSDSTGATCVTAGTVTNTCTRCGYYYTESGALDPTNHESVITDAAVAATCTEPGLTEGSHCEACEETIVDQDVIPALGHNHEVSASTDATCATAGSVTYTCTRCGDTYTDEGVLDPTNHEGTEVTDEASYVAPTRGEDGKEADTVCSVCGDVITEGAVIEALGVQITVEGTDGLGTVTLNSDAVEFGSTTKVDYESGYTLVAAAADGAEFVGWSVNGKIVSTSETYTAAAYADMTYVAVFAEVDDTFTVTFMDSFGKVLGTISSDALGELTEADLPDVYTYLDYTFAGWSMSIDEINALDAAAIVTAQYVKDDTVTYTVTAEGATITVNGVDYADTAEVGVDAYVTVKADDATVWYVNGATAAYGDEYSFCVTSDVTVTFGTDAAEAVPTVTAVSATYVEESAQVRFLSSRSVPDGYTVVQAGYLYGKDFADAETSLVLENANVSGSGVYVSTTSNTANDGQFALTFGISAQTGVAYARAYVIVADSEGNTSVIYADVQSYDYDA